MKTALLVFFVINLCSAKHPESLSVAAFLGSKDSQLQIPIRSSIWQNRYRQRQSIDVNVDYIEDNDYYKNTKTLCKSIETIQPVAVFSAETPASSIFQSICSNLDLPYVQTNWRNFDSFKGSETSLSFYPDSDLVAQALTVLLRSLSWKSFIILYETNEGLVRLQEILKYEDNLRTGALDHVVVRQLVPGEDHRSVLKEIKENQVILDCEAEHLADILQEAKDVNMLEYYHDYFITSFDANSVDLTFLQTQANITTISIFNYEDEHLVGVVQDWELNEFRDGRITTLDPVMIKTETALLHDALVSMFEVLNDLSFDEEPALACGNTIKSTHGTKIIERMKSAASSQSSITGPAEFDEMGRRTNFTIYLRDWNTQKIIGIWNAKEPNDVQIFRTQDERMEAYLDRIKNNVFTVSTKFLEPYFMLKTPKEGEVLEGNEQYEGFVVDLMNDIATIRNYSGILFILTNENGIYNRETGEWSGIIGDVLSYRATFGVSDLTITPVRKAIVDFSSPFMRLGIGALLKDPDAVDKTWAFLLPMTKAVWFSSATFFLIQSLVLWFVARMAPGDWENMEPKNPRPRELNNIWDLKNGFWIMLGTITNQGCDIYPKGISSRMTASMFWLFAIIITNSYIANLASFLTTDMQSTINNIAELGEQNRVKYGCVEGGSTRYSFQTSDYRPYIRMYNNMLLAKPSVFVANLEEGVRRVQNDKGKYAFLTESTQIEYVTATKCDLKSISGSLYPSMFGIAMQQNSPHRKDINKAILELESSGQLIKLKEKWWKTMRKEPLCVEAPKKGGELDFAEISGVFLVLGAGIGLAFVFGLIEFLWNIREVCLKQHVSVLQALKLELLSSLKFWMTEKYIKLLQTNTSGDDKNVTENRAENKSNDGSGNGDDNTEEQIILSELNRKKDRSV